MRSLAILLCSSALAVSTGGAQSTDAHVARWQVGPSVLIGAGILVGASVSRQLLQLPWLHLSADVSGFRPAFNQPTLACVNSIGCRNAPQPDASALVFLGLRTTVPLSRRWYGVVDAAVVQGHWRDPFPGTHRGFTGGVGLGHQSRTGRHALELRFHRLGSASVPVTTGRVGWILRW